MEPVAVGVQFGFGDRFVERNRKSFAEFAGFVPSVTFNLQTFEGFLIGKVVEKSVREFVKEKKAKILVTFDIEDRFARAEEEFLAGFEREVGAGGF